MDIPNARLNSSDATANEFQSRTVKQRINTRSCGNKLIRLGAGNVFASSPGLAEGIDVSIRRRSFDII
jgi:hypothetical protein